MTVSVIKFCIRCGGVARAEIVFVRAQAAANLSKLSIVVVVCSNAGSGAVSGVLLVGFTMSCRVSRDNMLMIVRMGNHPGPCSCE